MLISVGAMGVEPTWSRSQAGWRIRWPTPRFALEDSNLHRLGSKPSVLPLDEGRVAVREGFEPPTPRASAECSTGLSYLTVQSPTQESNPHLPLIGQTLDLRASRGETSRRCRRPERLGGGPLTTMTIRLSNHVQFGVQESNLRPLGSGGEIRTPVTRVRAERPSAGLPRSVYCVCALCDSWHTRHHTWRSPLLRHPGRLFASPCGRPP